jgi:hypothetical protein
MRDAPADAADAADPPSDAVDAAETGPDGAPDADAMDGTGDADTLPDGPWRSRLYPTDWQPYRRPADQPFLHDFSWAGYRNSEAEPGRDLPGQTFDVVADFGADDTGKTDATGALQQAIDAAEQAGGGIVKVPAGTYRLDGTLKVEASRVVLRGEGPDESRLYFTKSKGMDYRSHITFAGGMDQTTEWSLAEDAGIGDRTVRVRQPGDIAEGDDVAVGWTITPAFVREHGMEGTWQAFNGQWEPFFRREVVAVDRSADPPAVTLDVPLRYRAKVRDGASVKRETGYLSEVGVEGLGLANAVGWDAAWARDQVDVLEFDGVEDGWIGNVASFKPPTDSGRPAGGKGSEDHLQSGGLIIRRSKRVTVAETTLREAQHRGSGGNGYLFEIRTSSEILVRDSVGREGRHNFIQNWGFGTTGCVWLRVTSSGGETLSGKEEAFGSVGLSEFHHSLAMANLIDASRFEDGWGALNRKMYSSGAGHTATQNVIWNATGGGKIASWQYGRGYVIGTGSETEVNVDLPDIDLGPLSKWEGTAPRDWTEGIGRAADLRPQSLFESQLARRLP